MVTATETNTEYKRARGSINPQINRINWHAQKTSSLGPDSVLIYTNYNLDQLYWLVDFPQYNWNQSLALTVCPTLYLCGSLSHSQLCIPGGRTSDQKQILCSTFCDSWLLHSELEHNLFSNKPHSFLAGDADTCPVSPLNDKLWSCQHSAWLPTSFRWTGHQGCMVSKETTHFCH